LSITQGWDIKWSMIHCVCRNINTQKVDEAAASGAQCAQSVLAHHGHNFNCGGCKVSIETRLAELSVTPILEAAE